MSHLSDKYGKSLKVMSGEYAWAVFHLAREVKELERKLQDAMSKSVGGR